MSVTNISPRDDRSDLTLEQRQWCKDNILHEFYPEGGFSKGEKPVPGVVEKCDEAIGRFTAKVGRIPSRADMRAGYPFSESSARRAYQDAVKPLSIRNIRKYWQEKFMPETSMFTVFTEDEKFLEMIKKASDRQVEYAIIEGMHRGLIQGIVADPGELARRAS